MEVGDRVTTSEGWDGTIVARDAETPPNFKVFVDIAEQTFWYTQIGLALSNPRPIKVPCYRVLRLIEYTYASPEDMVQDMALWTVNLNHGRHGSMRSSHLVPEFVNMNAIDNVAESSQLGEAMKDALGRHPLEFNVTYTVGIGPYGEVQTVERQ